MAEISLTVQFYKERGHFADTGVGNRGAIWALHPSPFLCLPSPYLISHQALSVGLLLQLLLHLLHILLPL